MGIELTGLKAIQERLKHIDTNLHPTIVRDATEDAFNNVKRRAHKHHDTGNMENNISFRVHKDYGEVFIEDNAMMVEYKGKKINYATFVLYGTRSHWIHPKEKKQLRYASVKNFVHKQAIKHPGYKGDNFLYDGVQDTFKKLDKILDKAVNNELK